MIRRFDGSHAPRGNPAEDALRPLLADAERLGCMPTQSVGTINEVFIADCAILETEWVLRYAYDFEPAAICPAFRKLFGLKNVHLSNAQLIARVVDWHETGLDFADAFHLAGSQQCSSLKTFDDRFIKRSAALSDCMVEKP